MNRQQRKRSRAFNWGHWNEDRTQFRRSQINEYKSRRSQKAISAYSIGARGCHSTLSGPAHTFGPSGVAKVRWRKPLPAIIADAIANSRGLSARLQRGMYMPDEGGKSFAEALERAIIRSQSSVPLLNGPAPELPAEELKKPMARYRRF